MKKILVIEDAQSLRRDIIEMLSFEGFDVIGAENGLVGVQTARDNRPDLIICDIMMPVMDGYGVLEAIRGDAKMAMTPFIFLTARTDRVDVRQGMELGADDYLPKPFTASELLATVHTRLQKAEVQQQKAEEQLNTLRGHIILALPHELRTPLNVILGFSDLMMMDDFDPRVNEMARHIHTGATRLFRLIENYLTYANLEILSTSPEQLAQVRELCTHSPASIVQYAAMNRAQTVKRDADLHLDIHDVPLVRAGEDQIRKIVDELVDNAAKFSTAGTPIHVAARHEDDAYVVRISDQGRGMTADQIASVGAYMQFERHFYEQQGSGLGLIISKRLATICGGSIRIESVPQQGTTVVVSLPLSQS